MKKLFRTALTMLLALTLVFCMTGCGKKADTSAETLWKSAVYSSDTKLGEGEKTFSIEVKVIDRSVNFTISTNKETVGDALQENGLIAGEEGQYGLYIKTVNGITADYDKDQTYWAFYIGNQYAPTGVDTTSIDENAVYKLEYTK